MVKIILSLFFLGLSFGWGPCVASCGPILISYVAGTKKGILKSISVYLIFSLSRIFVYLILGLLVFLAGRFFTEQFLGGSSKYILIGGGIFIIIMGILVALGKRIEFKSWCRFQEKFLQRDKKSILLFGLITGFLPCAPLLVVLSYIALVSKTWWQGLFLTFSFGLGTLLSPLILLVIFASLLPKFFVNLKEFYMRIFSFVCGLIIIFLGANMVMRGLLRRPM